MTHFYAFPLTAHTEHGQKQMLGRSSCEFECVRVCVCLGAMWHAGRELRDAFHKSGPSNVLPSCLRLMRSNAIINHWKSICIVNTSPDNSGKRKTEGVRERESKGVIEQNSCM